MQAWIQEFLQSTSLSTGPKNRCNFKQATHLTKLCQAYEDALKTSTTWLIDVFLDWMSAGARWRAWFNNGRSSITICQVAVIGLHEESEYHDIVLETTNHFTYWRGSQASRIDRYTGEMGAGGGPTSKI
ncbi:hypothetical protein PsorP6_000833 [Peronosclerospora sorghi]|uniref:Uncharacterized protein n=1 Tax=Peronosclerospora sorghi TaxID=230839 RepID=A0ACC0WYV6_9STRA|nr:hypothetical protein PsorP6_000833 [Peronosclerospora sorghi]